MALSEENKQKLFFGSAIDHLVDPVRSTRWRMCIPTEIFRSVGMEPTNGETFANADGDIEFTLHIVGGPTLPGVKTEAKAINYMGFEKFYPVKQQNLAGEAEFTALFLEDMRAYEAMVAWNQSCLNTGILSNTEMSDALHATNRTAQDSKNKVMLGLGQQENHRNATANLLRNTSCRLELYDWMYGEVILSVLYVNAWPLEVNVSDSLGYDQANLMKFKFKLKYDRFNLWIPPGYKTIV